MEELDIFYGWDFYHGYARYAQWGAWEHIFVATNVDHYGLIEKMVNALDDSDTEALCAADDINKLVKDGKAFLGHNTDPIKALQMCVDAVKTVHLDTTL